VVPRTWAKAVFPEDVWRALARGITLSMAVEEPLRVVAATALSQASLSTEGLSKDRPRRRSGKNQGRDLGRYAF